MLVVRNEQKLLKIRKQKTASRVDRKREMIRAVRKLRVTNFFFFEKKKINKE